MKKRLYSFLVAVLLIMGLSATVYAQETTDNLYIYDVADLLTIEQEIELQEQATQIADTYDCAVYIVTLEDFQNEGSYTSDEMGLFAEDLYEIGEFGIGEEHTGIMLSLSMAARDYDFLAHGSAAHTAFTDYGKDLMAEDFLSCFKNDDWYGGFSRFMSDADAYLYQAANGTPVDVPKVTMMDRIMQLLVCMVIGIIPGCIIAKFFVNADKRAMKTARKAAEAENYFDPQNMVMQANADVFIYMTTTTRIIETKSSSGSGGTTVNSRGYSHKSGKF